MLMIVNTLGGTDIMKKCFILALLLLVPAGLTAHPHFRKSVSVQLQGVEAVVAYTTVPANETYAQNAETGAFVTPRGPRLTLSADLQAGAISVPKGEYVIGAIKNGQNDWTMALYPGRLGRGESPDASKFIKLDSLFSDSHGTAQHLTVDIAPGHGRFEGRAVLVLHFGSLLLEGALS